MRPLSTYVTCLLAAAGLVGVAAADSAGGLDGDQFDEPGLAGRVLVHAATPIAAADVFAYDVTSSDTHEVRTDELGRFLFDDLPAGMYKLVAFKAGFSPAVELLLRRRDEDRQFIELELEPRIEGESETASKHDYWTVRGRIPSDVLRQIERLVLAQKAREGLWLDGADLFRAEMWAQSGSQHFGGSGAPSAALRSAEVDLRGRIGDVKLGLGGVFQDLAASQHLEGLDGQVRQLALHVEPTRYQRLQVATIANQLLGPSSSPVDVERYRVDWMGRAGKHGQTRVSASYEEEQNYHVGDGLRPVDIPGYSETWGLEGSFQGDLAEHTALTAGISYRQRTLGMVDGLEMPDESLDLFTTAESTVRQGFVVEYGLVSSMSDDGSYSLMPHGGVVVELGDEWRARTSIAKRVEQRDPVQPYSTFDSAFFAEDRTCHDAGDACYEITLARGGEEDEITVGASHREFAETLRLYFSPDFFDRLESVFVVEGDELPEVTFSMVRRLAPQVLTRLESNVAEGGGGIFYATDDAPYRNHVRYLVTSLDTRFQRTSTGVLLSFHHLEQALQPLDNEATPARKVEMQRLQLMLTQDLDVLLDLATRWAVRLNMELSRGATPYALTADGELYKKLTGGFAVSF
ncbi:MAG: carboxypeptidase-like regulatory domain-containing protein [Acidobacteriota bacterium]